MRQARPARPVRPRRRRQRHPVFLTEPPDGADIPQARLISRGTADQVLTIGLPHPWHGDLYHLALRVPWWRFLLGAFAIYGLANTVFALLYLAQSGAIANAEPGSFGDAFFFSVETMATVGYGQMTPATLYANIVMTFETGVGLLLVAVMTGVMFARFSRPTARILFSRLAVVGPYNGIPTISFRLANQRRNQILQAEVNVVLLRDELTAEGTPIRRFYDLKLARYRSPVFALSFTVMHPIDRDSPLHGATSASLQAMNAELIVTASGIDEIIADRVHVRTSYLPDEIRWNHRFADVMGWTPEGQRVIDYRMFHDTVPLGEIVP